MSCCECPGKNKSLTKVLLLSLSLSLSLTTFNLRGVSLLLTSSHRQSITHHTLCQLALTVPVWHVHLHWWIHFAHSSVVCHLLCCSREREKKKKKRRKKLKNLTLQLNGDCRVSFCNHFSRRTSNIKCFSSRFTHKWSPGHKACTFKCHSAACMTDFRREEDDKQKREEREREERRLETCYVLFLLCESGEAKK